MPDPPLYQTLHVDARKLPAEVFERVSARAGLLRERAERNERAWESFGKPGRDPDLLGGVLSIFASDRQWTPYLKIAQMRNHWEQVVGPAIAQHSYAASFRDGVLVIQTDSPVWATNLTYLIPQLTDTIRERLSGLDVREIRVTGPQNGRLRRGGGARYRR